MQFGSTLTAEKKGDAAPIAAGAGGFSELLPVDSLVVADFFGSVAATGGDPATGVGDTGASAPAVGSLSTSSAMAQRGFPSSMQTVRLAGSGLVFVNTYTSNVSQAYQSAIIAAENYFQQRISSSVTLNFTFDTLNGGTGGFVGSNSFSTYHASYASLRSALASHVSSADDAAAVAALLSRDITGGAGFDIPAGLAEVLGFVSATGAGYSDTTYLNSAYSYFYNQNSPVAGAYDAVSTLEHEISEGMGRVGGLGLPSWSTLDLFRYAAPGGRDVTGGRDGLDSYFSIDGNTLLMQFHNPLDRRGFNDGEDSGDWELTGDAYGPQLSGQVSPVSAIDDRVMDVIGWNGISPPVLASTLPDFSWAQGWHSAAFTRLLVADTVQHDSIYVGFGGIGTVMAWGVPGAASPAFAEFGLQSVPIFDFGTNQGYDATRTRGMAVYGTANSNGVLYQQDIVYGQGDAGVYFYRPVSAAMKPNGAVVPTYETGPELYQDFGANQGWNQHYNFQTAVTTHQTPDIVGFAIAGMLVASQAFLPGANAAQEYFAAASSAIGNAAGWDSLNDVRTIVDQTGKPIDLNGDHIPDFVGMGPNGLNYAYGARDANGNFQLGSLQTAHINGAATDLGNPQGWNNATMPRIIADINNDGRPDIVGFGPAGTYVALGQDPATHGGEPFGQLYLGVADFGLNQNWTVASTPRLIADVNGDGIADIVGFGASAVFTDLGTADAVGRVTWAPDPSATINDFGYQEGWGNTTFRGAADVSGTGHADLVLSGAYNTQVWHYS